MTIIGSGAFDGCTNLQSITLPFVGAAINSGYTHFGWIFGASSYSSNDAYVPASLKTVVVTGGSSISNNAFRGCGNIVSIEIPSSVTSIGNDAFYGCRNLQSITLPFVGTAINSGYAHFGWIFGASSYSSNDAYVPASLKTVVITGGSSISNNAFRDCGNIVSIEIPSSVISIGDSAFSGCTNLQNVTFAEGSLLQSIGNHAFYDCASLASIEIPSSVTSIGDYAFYGCAGLESVTFAEGSLLQSIGNYAFYKCKSLASIEIPSSVISIGESAFSVCANLASIEIPSSVTSIGGSAFWECFNLRKVYYGGSEEQWGDISISYENNSLTGATRYYYSETEPAQEGNFWHRVDGEIVEW